MFWSHLLDSSNDCSAASSYKRVLLDIQHGTWQNALRLRGLCRKGLPPVQLWAFRRASSQILVEDKDVPDIVNFLESYGMCVMTVLTDVQKLVLEQDLERTQRLSHRALKNSFKEMNWKDYHPLETIVAHLKYLSRSCEASPAVSKELRPIGYSVEGNPILLFRFNPGNSETKFWIDGGTHAREWISPAVVMYILEQLVNFYPENRKIADQFDWHIVPCLNPDGYEYSFQRSKDDTIERIFERRLWRKNRHDYHFGPSAAVGVDLNRNFDVNFGGRGASLNPTEEDYAGPVPFSEPETRSMRDYLLKHRGFLVMLSFHSYGQLILTPHGTKRKKPPNFSELKRVGNAMAAAIRKETGRIYSVGNAYKLLYPAPLSIDWGFEVVGIPYTYLIELPDKGKRGFLLPPREIEGICREIWSGLNALVFSVKSHIYAPRKLPARYKIWNMVFPCN